MLQLWKWTDNDLIVRSLIQASLILFAEEETQLYFDSVIGSE